MFEAKASIQDSLSPETLAQLAQSFGLEMEPIDYVDEPMVNEHWLESHLGFVTGEHLWDALWRFGVIVDDDLEWYIPDDNSTVDVAIIAV